MPKLGIVVGSTRPGRAGLPIAQWFAARAKEHGKFELDFIDLAELNLPLLDEPEHPRLRKYQKEHTKAWSARVEACDAFVFVTPEYNYSAAPALLNALDYLFHEWSFKPAAFVSYGGASGGLRAVQATKATVTALNMMAIPQGVALPFFMQSLKPEGFNPPETQSKAVEAMLDALLKWAVGLKQLRSAA